MQVSSTQSPCAASGGFRSFASLLLALFVMVISTGAQTREQDENAKPPAPMRYERTLGPFTVDGQAFTVKLNLMCYKDSPHPGMCSEDDEEAVKSAKIVDERNRTRFSKSFPIGFMHQLDRYNVRATLLRGSEHQAIEMVYEKLPSHADTGVSIQLFGVREGKLQALNDDPLEFFGRLGELPSGPQKDSKNLLPGDVLPIYALTNYFYVLVPLRIDWKDFDLEEPDSGEFDVVQQAPYGRKPDVRAEGFVHLRSAPDEKAEDAGVNVTPQSNVEVLKAQFRAMPPEEHDGPNEMWLKVSVDGKVGWILGLDDYTAIGLSSRLQE